MKITLKKRRKQTEKKYSKIKRKKKKNTGKVNNKRLWFYLLYKYIYIARKHSLKKQFI